MAVALGQAGRPHKSEPRALQGLDDAGPATPRSPCFRISGTDFRRAQPLARLRRRRNGEIVSVADWSQDNGLGRGAGEIGPGKNQQPRAT